MARYSIDGAQAVASPDDTTLTLTADATRPRRCKVYDIILGSSATPADNALIRTVQRCTAAGTSSAVTPLALDPADVATEDDAGENHTVEPTYTAAAQLLVIAMNQRATYRWVAAPGGELVTPATAANGVGEFATHASFTGSVETTMHFENQ